LFIRAGVYLETVIFILITVRTWSLRFSSSFMTTDRQTYGRRYFNRRCVGLWTRQTHHYNVLSWEHWLRQVRYEPLARCRKYAIIRTFLYAKQHKQQTHCCCSANITALT
jgi:hypothetical protein